MSRAKDPSKGAPVSKSGLYRTVSALLGPKRGGDSGAKARKARLREASRRRAQAKHTVGYIGYDALYKDGVAQVEEGIFSQTVEFTDISYQSARKETQQTIFSVLSGLYNYFGADTSVQLSVSNVPVPADMIGRKRFFAHSTDITRPYVDEYNKILNDKLREGVSNLERHRYLTYSVGADDVDEATPKLARIRNDVVGTLGRIRVDAHALDGAERLAAMQAVIRPKKRLDFDWDRLSQYRGTCTKDYIAPMVLDFAPQGRQDAFASDGVYGSVLCIRDFGSMILPRFS